MKTLLDPLTCLPGIGQKRADQLADLGILTVLDLLSYYPFRYEDIQERQLDEIQDQEKVTLKGVVVAEPVVTYYGFKKNRLNFRLMVEHAVINVTFFNQPFLKDKIEVSADLAVFGKWDARRKALTGFKILGSQQGDFEPIYHVSKQVHQKTLIRLIALAFTEYGELIADILPPSLTAKYQLLSRKQAMYAMHFPDSPVESHQARRQVIFEEFFLYQMRLQALRSAEKTVVSGLAIHYSVDQLRTFIQQLPFELTAAQKRVTNEICSDLRRPVHMQRLLQGDVGSGKTVVAAIALYACVTAGYQGALMVPTEILAEQHLETLVRLFPVEVKIARLTSSTRTKERREILEQLQNGSLDIIVGTHALIQEEVNYCNLGLVITDEQHRFGVRQRQQLREKGANPNVLFMTATPIPRTLAITAFGEMDVSSLNELPAGRIPITTRWVRSAQLDTVLNWSKEELAKGRQVYVICPLIEESEALDVKNAQEIYAHLTDYYAPSYSVALLHGRMKAEEKDTIMENFKKNQTQVLVSTTVIEVGVDVPNATVMLIMDADRFGLAQLHQLRGRVGRGKQKSYCILVANPKNDTGVERMKIMTETTDGFLLSQKDLEMRGPGEFFGARQSGIPQFKVGDIVRDLAVLETARQEAIHLWNQADWQNQAENQALLAYLQINDTPLAPTD